MTRASCNKVVPKGARTIRAFSRALMVLALISQPARTQPAPTALSADDRTAVLTAREAVWRAWFAGDTARLRRLLPTNTLAVESGDSTWERRSEVIAGAANFHAHGGRLVRLEFPRVEIQALGDVVVLYSTFQLATEQSGKHSTKNGTAVEVFARRNGIWQNPSWYLDFTP